MHAASASHAVRQAPAVVLLMDPNSLSPLQLLNMLNTYGQSTFSYKSKLDIEEASDTVHELDSWQEPPVLISKEMHAEFASHAILQARASEPVVMPNSLRPLHP